MDRRELPNVVPDRNQRGNVEGNPEVAKYADL